MLFTQPQKDKIWWLPYFIRTHCCWFCIGCRGARSSINRRIWRSVPPSCTPPCEKSLKKENERHKSSKLCLDFSFFTPLHCTPPAASVNSSATARWSGWFSIQFNSAISSYYFNNSVNILQRFITSNISTLLLSCGALSRLFYPAATISYISATTLGCYGLVAVAAVCWKS